MLEHRVVVLEDGCRFVGVFFAGTDERVCGTKYYPNGATYSGTYMNNVRHGMGIKTHADGTEVEVEYRDGVKVK